MQYRYLQYASLDVGAGVSLLLSAIANGTIVYDLGVIMKNPSTEVRSVKHSRQFRVTAAKLRSLHESLTTMNACSGNWMNYSNSPLRSL